VNTFNRILVTGGAGFIGSHTVDLLLKKGYRVRVLDSLQERVHPDGWPSYLAPEVEKIRGDVRNKEDWESALVDVDGVFHLAAYQDYMPDFSTFFHVNTVSTALLFELIASRELPVRKVVLASSQSVYGEGSYRCATHGCLFPDSRPSAQLDRGDWEVRCPECDAGMEPIEITEEVVRPHTAYGISKYALEMASRELGRKYGVPAVCMRYSIVQGPRNSFYNAYSGICRLFTMRALHDQPPVCYEDGQQLRDYVFVGDVARANLLALESPAADYQAFNVGGLEATSVLDYARALIRITGKDLEPSVSGEYRFGDTRHTFSSSAALGRLGWRPEVGLESIISSYVEWARAQPGLAAFYAESERRMRAAKVLRQAAP
jgi:dTDP-L-rhamnose 4-epimerase